ncbi:MAG: methyltransferase domain-containing protein [Usitatibacter sp.]
MAFVDHFSAQPDLYARARPTYPEALFAFIAAESPARGSAWDCATGSGQAAIGLARHFDFVEATDASPEQIAHAIAAPRVRYSVQPAESTTFGDRTFDAVCVASALHWFDIERFYAEVKRVLKPGGVLAAWGYTRHHVTPEFDAAFATVFLEPIKPYWPEQSSKLRSGYRDEAFPFTPIEAPRFTIEARWSLEELVAYAGTWSATQRYLGEAGDPEFLRKAAQALAPAWGQAERRVVTLPLHLRCGRHPM